MAIKRAAAPKMNDCFGDFFLNGSENDNRRLVANSVAYRRSVHVTCGQIICEKSSAYLEH